MSDSCPLVLFGKTAELGEGACWGGLLWGAGRTGVDRHRLFLALKLHGVSVFCGGRYGNVTVLTVGQVGQVGKCKSKVRACHSPLYVNEYPAILVY